MMMREWVFKALLDVISEKTYSNLYLKNHLEEVDEKDQKLAVNIFYGTLQNYALCEAAWKPYARGRVKKKASVLLTMSVYQMLFLSKVPAYAIVNEANRIAARIMPEQRSMINAILRKVTPSSVVFPQDPAAALALKTSLPKWLIRLWISQYGPKEAFAFANASLNTLPVTVRLNPRRISQQEAQGIGRLQRHEDGLYSYTGAHIGSDPLFRSGKISVQDPGSYVIARWVDPKPGEKILDVCAAPGTKSMAMAEMAGDQAEITAGDLYPHRVELIEKDAKRLHLSGVHAIVQDACQLEDNPVYDAVLCDVPCSGLGILSRKPDMKLRLNTKTLDELTALQKEILNHAALQVRPGGRLIYSTCTLNRKENEKQVEDFLKTHPDFRLDSSQTLIPDDRQGGFFIARLLKNPAEGEKSADIEAVTH